MATRIPTNVQNALADAARAFIDADVGAGTMQIRTGAQPATANLAATGTLLVTVTFNDPAFLAAAAGVSTMDDTPAVTGTGVAAGTAGWFRILDNSGDTVMDGSVTATGGGGDLEMNTTSVSVGLPVTVTAGTLTMPASE